MFDFKNIKLNRKNQLNESQTFKKKEEEKKITNLVFFPTPSRQFPSTSPLLFPQTLQDVSLSIQQLVYQKLYFHPFPFVDYLLI